MNQKLFFVYALTIPFIISSLKAQNKLNTFAAADSNIHYFGRTIATDKGNIRCWAPGAYMQAKFAGNTCKLMISDEVKYGQNHNYIEVVFDNKPAQRIKLKKEDDTLSFNLSTAKEHTVTVYKSTESGIGFIDFCGMQCQSLLPVNNIPSRKIEFIGNSVTSGAGSDITAFPCGEGAWYDQYNAYKSYGSITARALNAQFHVSAVSGIGLMHSCCNMGITMPQVFNKVDMREDSITWDFTKYQPDVITICLGQNDDIQDSLAFCTAYITFLNQLRTYYHSSEIICLNSPMADAALTNVLKNYITFCVNYLNKAGDNKVHTFYFSKQFHNGCDGLPDLKEHELIAAELTAYIKQLLKW